MLGQLGAPLGFIGGFKGLLSTSVCPGSSRKL